MLAHSLAFGSRANMNLVPGMAEHAMPGKLLGDALALRDRVIGQMEKAEQEEDSATRQWLGHFVIIGAGCSGVEIGGGIQDFIHASHKHYTKLHDSMVTIGHLDGVAEIFSGSLPIPCLDG
jgi:NADH dehydrogenase